MCRNVIFSRGKSQTTLFARQNDAAAAVTIAATSE